MQTCLEAGFIGICTRGYVLGSPEYINNSKKMSKTRAKIILVVTNQNYEYI